MGEWDFQTAGNTFTNNNAAFGLNANLGYVNSFAPTQQQLYGGNGFGSLPAYYAGVGADYSRAGTTGNIFGPIGGGGGGGGDVWNTGAPAYNDYGLPALGAGSQPNFGAPDFGYNPWGGVPQASSFDDRFSGTPATFDQRFGNPGDFNPTTMNVPRFDTPTQQPAVDWDRYFNQVTAPTRGSGSGWEGAYLAANPDVLDAARASGMDPNKFADQHWKNYGQNEGRQFFDSVKYLDQNQDVAAAGVDPLQHYLKFGRAEGRGSPEMMGSVFDPSTYLGINGDVAAAGVDPLKHWLQYGQKEGRQGGGIVMNAGDDPSWLGAGGSNNPYNPFGKINSGGVGQWDSFLGAQPPATFDQRFGNLPGQPYGQGYFDNTFGAVSQQPQAYNPTFGGVYPGRLGSDNMANQQDMIADLWRTLGIIDNAGDSQPDPPGYGNTLRSSDYSLPWTNPGG